MEWFSDWLDGVATRERQVLLIGFSGGAAFAGGLALGDPSRYAGVAILSGTLPFDAGVPTTPHRLDGLPVFLSQGDADTVIPLDLQVRTREYLENESGATLETSVDSGGHTISQSALERLTRWTTDCLDSAASGSAQSGRSA
jgi:phospholipase/carboxylesterase